MLKKNWFKKKEKLVHINSHLVLRKPSLRQKDGNSISILKLPVPVLNQQQQL